MELLLLVFLLLAFFGLSVAVLGLSFSESATSQRLADSILLRISVLISSGLRFGGECVSNRYTYDSQQNKLVKQSPVMV